MRMHVRVSACMCVLCVCVATRELERPRIDEIQAKNEAENLQKNEDSTKDDEGIRDTMHEQEDEKEERMKKKSACVCLVYACARVCVCVCACIVYACIYMHSTTL